MRICLSKKAKAGATVVAVTVAALISYEVRALVAALIIFSVTFTAFATAFLVLALIQEALLWGMHELQEMLIRLIRFRDERTPILPKA